MGIFSLYTGSNNGYLLYKGAGIAGLYAYANANLIYTGNLSPAATAKATLAYDPTSAYTTYNGSSVLSFSNATVATPTNLLFGGNWYVNQMTGYLKKFKFYPTRIADNELELLTQ